MSRQSRSMLAKQKQTGLFSLRRSSVSLIRLPVCVNCARVCWWCQRCEEISTSCLLTVPKLLNNIIEIHFQTNRSGLNRSHRDSLRKESYSPRVIHKSRPSTAVPRRKGGERRKKYQKMSNWKEFLARVVRSVSTRCTRECMHEVLIILKKNRAFDNKRIEFPIGSIPPT